MKILHINTFDQWGGAEQFALNFVHHSKMDSCLLCKTKYNVSPKVYCFPKNILDHCLAFSDKVIWKLNIKKSFREIFFLGDEFHFTYKKLKDNPYYKECDIVHLHNIHGSYFDIESLLLIAKDKYIVWTLHDMWIMTGGEAYTFENDNYKIGIGTTPYIANYPLNNPVIDRRQHFLQKKKSILKQIAPKLLITIPSRWLKDCFTNSFVYNNNNINVKHLPYGIDLDIFNNENVKKWEIPRILFFNSDSPFKGSNIFLQIFKEIQSPFYLINIGQSFPGSLQNKNCEKILNLGFINSRRRLAYLYNLSDILVFPSLADNFPITILEAMACGVCVIGSKLGGIVELLEFDNGILFESQNEEDLLSKINATIANLYKTREIGMNATSVVKEKYDVKKMYANYADLYDSLLAAKQL